MNIKRFILCVIAIFTISLFLSSCTVRKTGGTAAVPSPGVTSTVIASVTPAITPKSSSTPSASPTPSPSWCGFPCDTNGDGRDECCPNDKPVCKEKNRKDEDTGECKTVMNDPHPRDSDPGHVVEECVKCSKDDERACLGSYECCIDVCYNPNTQHCCSSSQCPEKRWCPGSESDPSKQQPCCDANEDGDYDSCGSCFNGVSFECPSCQLYWPGPDLIRRGKDCKRCDHDGDGIKESCFTINTDSDPDLDKCYECDRNGDGEKDTDFLCNHDAEEGNDDCYTCDIKGANGFIGDGDGKKDSCYRCSSTGDGVMDTCCDKCLESDECSPVYNPSPPPTFVQCKYSLCNFATGECEVRNERDRMPCGDDGSRECCQGICCPKGKICVGGRCVW